jgi:hypothetical protein
MNIKQAEEIVELVRKHKLEKSELDKIENIQKDLSRLPNSIEDRISIALDLKHRPSTFVIRNLVDSLKAEQSKRVAEVNSQIEKLIIIPPAPKLNPFFSIDFGADSELLDKVRKYGRRFDSIVMGYNDGPIYGKEAVNEKGPVDGVKQEVGGQADHSTDAVRYVIEVTREELKKKGPTT